MTYQKKKNCEIKWYVTDWIVSKIGKEVNPNRDLPVEPKLSNKSATLTATCR